MNRIQQAYAMYYNGQYADAVKRGHKAPVFEGRFKSKLITDEDYLAQVAYYIRHNAIKHDIVDEIRDWPWGGSTESPEFPAFEYARIDPEFDAGFE